MSDLSNRAKQRNWLKMRLMGCESIFYNKIITNDEKLIMSDVLSDIKLLIDNFDENSKKLGFNVKPKKQ